MIIMEFFNKKNKCKHDKFSPDKDIGYCPDCGELIENQWFILRCACCGVKVKAMIRNGTIVPVEKHCTNCGMAEFNVEKLEKVNFINVNYAVLMKKTVKSENFSFTQSWVDVTNAGTLCGKLGLLK